MPPGFSSSQVLILQKWKLRPRESRASRAMLFSASPVGGSGLSAAEAGRLGDWHCLLSELEKQPLLELRAPCCHSSALCQHIPGQGPGFCWLQGRSIRPAGGGGGGVQLWATTTPGRQVEAQGPGSLPRLRPLPNSAGPHFASTSARLLSAASAPPQPARGSDSRVTLRGSPEAWLKSQGNSRCGNSLVL